MINYWKKLPDCSRRCAWNNNGKWQEKQSFVWWKNNKGYIEGRITEKGITRRVKYHRWIMEQHLGRKLSTSEDIHHLNGIKDDNRLENLSVIDHSEHTTQTNLNREYNRGYKMKLSKDERKRRSEAAKDMKLDEMGRAAIALATAQ